MKNRTKLFATAAVGCLMGAAVVAQTNTSNTDPLFVKATSDKLVRSLRRSSKSPVTMVGLVSKSIESKETEAVFKTLDKMRREQPNNAAVLAAYAMAHDASLYQVRRSTGTIRQRTPQETQSADEALRKAKQLDPELWLPYTIEGFRLGYAPPWDYNRALPLLQKGVELAPQVAFARKQFAAILQMAANNNGKWDGRVVTHERAAAEYEKALKLDPKSADTAFALFSIYDIDLKDKQGATRAKRAFLKTLPPRYNIRKSVRDRLARYPA